MKRGEIYYIESTYRETGSEQRGGRPAVIVSNDKNNENSELAAVDSALAISLGIDFMDPKPAAKEAEHLLEEISKQPLRIVQQDPDVEKIKLETERDLYRNLYNELLNKTMKGASA
jgi:mRNA interferase MazF